MHQTLDRLDLNMENVKKREYQDRILQVEHWSFTPLVFSSTGGMGPEASMALKKLATSMAEKRQEPLSQVMAVPHCVLSDSSLNRVPTWNAAFSSVCFPN